MSDAYNRDEPRPATIIFPGRYWLTGPRPKKGARPSEAYDWRLEVTSHEWWPFLKDIPCRRPTDRQIIALQVKHGRDAWQAWQYDEETGQ